MTYSIEFNPDAKVSYGSWKCPECKNQFYGGGPALHARGCSKTGYDGLIYLYTATEKEHALKEGFVPLAPIGFVRKIQEEPSP